MEILVDTALVAAELVADAEEDKATWMLGNVVVRWTEAEERHRVVEILGMK